MIQKEHYFEIAEKYGQWASWAIWAEEGDRPKSNMGDTSIFDLNKNPDILNQINPNVIMVGLNFSRATKKERFGNFHDRRPQAQDYKIRYAFKNTKYYGAYMTDIIKDFKQQSSHKVSFYLKENRDFEEKNISLFQEEINDLKSTNPLIIAFGNEVFKILNRHFKNKYRIIKVPHYSIYISKEDYKIKVENVLINYEGFENKGLQENNDEQKIIQGLKVIQRVQRISATTEPMSLLLEIELHSAHAIVSMPKSRFIKKYSKDFGKILAKEIYVTAKRMQRLQGEEETDED